MRIKVKQRFGKCMKFRRVPKSKRFGSLVALLMASSVGPALPQPVAGLTTSFLKVWRCSLVSTNGGVAYGRYSNMALGAAESIVVV